MPKHLEFQFGTESFLSSHRRWDVLDRDTLPSFRTTRRMSADDGYLLRHYWTPPEVLHYEIDLRQQLPDGETTNVVSTISRTMCRCDVDRCVWRESVREAWNYGIEPVRFLQTTDREVLCEYDRASQTFWTKSILGRNDAREDIEAARLQAMLRVPVLIPLPPIPVGFRWHVEIASGDSKGSFIDFELESANENVLLIRRRGRLLLREFYRGNRFHPHQYVLEREGLTAYSLGRCLVLEDRTRDIVVSERNRKTPLEGTVAYTVQKLVDSSLS